MEEQINNIPPEIKKEYGYFVLKTNKLLLVVCIICVIVALTLIFKHNQTKSLISSDIKEEQDGNIKAEEGIEYRIADIDSSQIMGKKEDLISFSVKPNSTVQGLLKFKGKILNNWFSDGEVYIRALGPNEEHITHGLGYNTTNWLTSGPVSFAGEMELYDADPGLAYLVIDSNEENTYIKIPIFIGKDKSLSDEENLIRGVRPPLYKCELNNDMYYFHSGMAYDGPFVIYDNQGEFLDSCGGGGLYYPEEQPLKESEICSKIMKMSEQNQCKDISLKEESSDVSYLGNNDDNSSAYDPALWETYNSDGIKFSYLKSSKFKVSNWNNLEYWILYDIIPGDPNYDTIRVSYFTDNMSYQNCMGKQDQEIINGKIFDICIGQNYKTYTYSKGTKGISFGVFLDKKSPINLNTLEIN